LESQIFIDEEAAILRYLRGIGYQAFLETLTDTELEKAKVDLQASIDGKKSTDAQIEFERRFEDWRQKNIYQPPGEAIE
jgi:hypothetical protein